MKWYKRDPDAWLGGVVGLSPEERGVYDTVIETLYSRDLNIPSKDDDRFWSRACCCDPRTWRRVRDQLLAEGKLYLELDGKLMARRVREEFERAQRRIEVCSESRQKQLQNQRRASELTHGKPQPQPDPEKKKREARKRATPFPKNWTPEEGLPTERHLLEFEKAKDWALKKGAAYVDWEAFWRNWWRNRDQFNRGNGNGQERSVLAAADRQIEQFGGTDAARRYVPGSEGPRPLKLDNGVRPPSPKLISSR